MCVHACICLWERDRERQRENLSVNLLHVCACPSNSDHVHILCLSYNMLIPNSKIPKITSLCKPCTSNYPSEIMQSDTQLKQLSNEAEWHTTKSKTQKNLKWSSVTHKNTQKPSNDWCPKSWVAGQLHCWWRGRCPWGTTGLSPHCACGCPGCGTRCTLVGTSASACHCCSECRRLLLWSPSTLPVNLKRTNEQSDII